jgi:CRISPR-associated protein Csb2
LPSYSLPFATVAHSRHYMPQGTLEKGKEKTALVLDTWAEVDGEIAVQWPIDLATAEIDLLEQLVVSMNYLGRSESWVEGRMLSAADFRPTCEPLRSADEIVGDKHELVTLMAPLVASDYETWRIEQCPPLDTTKTKPKAAQLKEHARKAAPFPIDLLDALQWDTAKWKKFGWSQPPGSRRVQYRRPHHALDCTLAVTPTNQGATPAPDLVLLALATPSRSMSALPTLARTLPQAELLHRALVSLSETGTGSVLPVLSGCDEQHKPLKGHAHAHILPLDLDADGHLEYILLWAPMGFTPNSLQAIRSLRRTWKKGGELHVAIVGQGQRDRLLEMPEGLDRYVTRSQHWISVTPFVPPRFVKPRGQNNPESQIRAEIRSRGLPEPSLIEIKSFPQSGALPEKQLRHFRHAVRSRKHGGTPPPQDVGWFVRLTFPTPVNGPLCLGYGSHFGLGLFVAVPPLPQPPTPSNPPP